MKICHMNFIFFQSCVQLNNIFDAFISNMFHIFNSFLNYMFQKCNNEFCAKYDCLYPQLCEGRISLWSFVLLFGTILLKTSELQQLQSKILLWNYKLHKYLSTLNDDSTTCKLKAQLKTHWRKRSVLFDLWVEVFWFSCTSTPLSLWEAEKGKVQNVFFHTYFWWKRNAFHSRKSQCDTPNQAWIYFCCPHYRGGILMTGWPSGYLEIMVFVIIVAPDCMEWEWWLLLVMVCTWT